MMYSPFKSFLFVFVWCFISYYGVKKVNGTVDIVSISVYHVVSSNNSYTQRSIVNLYNPTTYSYTLKQKPLTPEQYNIIQSLAEHDDYYKIKIVVKLKDGKKEPFYKFIKAKELIGSNLSDKVEVFVDISGFPVGFNYETVNMTHKVEHSYGDVIDNDDGIHAQYRFETRFGFSHPENAPVPDIIGYLQKMQKEKEAKLKGVGKDNRTFFAKYWMYIVPLMIFIVFTGSANQDAR